MSWFSSFSCSRRQVFCEQLLEGSMLRVPAVCNSQAWRILSVGPAFPEYLLHSVILGAKCRWLMPLLPFLLCSHGPAVPGPVAASGSARPSQQSCHCITAILPSHSGPSSFAFWPKCPEQWLREHGAGGGHGFSLEVCFWGVSLRLKLQWLLWGWSRAALNCLGVMTEVYSRAHGDH